MRIRSTKPEFWRSERIASVDWEDRLVLKGLESYVDDNGVGKDDLALIVGDLFSRDLIREPSRTLARVSEALSRLSRAGLLHRYEADGTRYLYLSFWESFQRIDKPTRGRFPRPDGTFNYGETQIGAPLANPRESSRALAPGTGEQGNRGTGEQGNRGTDGQPSLTAPPTPDEQPSTDDLFDRWWTDYPRKVHKPAARKAFTVALPKVHPDRVTACEQLTAAIREHSRHWLDLEGRPIDKVPHPATWLNAEAWSDELLPDDAYRARAASAAAETPTERIMRMRNAALAQLNGGESHHGNDRRMPRPALGTRVS